MSDLYFLDLALKQRINGVDYDAQTIQKQDYESTNTMKRDYTLTAGVNVTVSNLLGSWLLIADSSVDTARITLYVDGQSITFTEFNAGIYYGTAISVTSDINTTLSLSLIKVT